MTDSNTDSTPDAGDDAGTDTAIGESGGMLGATGTDAANTTEKDPSEWVTGDEPATGAQKSYLDTLAREAGETLSADLTKAEASEQIERLQAASGRGTDA
ncbi:DUF3072 domain-containing protein [uncultured Nocardioides sp.]|uniref:DUF3072 domain-containing protein n=1 Tax=uncultured Nocardioides sp. TaxID=198441 RepID=UPI0026060ABC|nr:DUF3072 domain-containing protein [uncultured Nocardioides sp.]